MERTLIKDLKDKAGEKVLVKAWVRNRRDHGKLSFFDLVDFSGIVQAVSTGGHASELRSEWVVEIEGTIGERPEKMVNEKQENGSVELKIEDLKIISKSETPPFELTEDTSGVDENVRLKYRYLDLRTERMQKNIRLRSNFIKGVREFLFAKDFTEIETPLLTKRTPEGARDFVVPSRIHPGKFYALPQSPQQYKQLLMTAGFERYFQIARALRDEDLRADRGFEHTQIDLEISFVNQKEVMNLVEEMITGVVENMGYKIKEKPFPVISYKEAMEKYGDDKFDLRTDKEKEEGVLAYAWVVDFPFFEKTSLPAGASAQAGDGKWTFTHNPFSMPKEEFIEDLLAGKNIENILTTQYDLVCNGFESGGGSIRSHQPEVLKAVYKVMGYSEEETEKSVGHMIEALGYGTPPHGGIALGVERNIMNLAGEEYLREVQAFPMTRGGGTAVMEAPNELEEKQLKELGLEIKNKEEN